MCSKLGILFASLLVALVLPLHGSLSQGANNSSNSGDGGRLWHELGVKDADIKWFENYGIDVNQAKKWFDYGVRSAGQIRELMDDGVDLQQAKRWHDSGVEPRLWRMWIVDKFSPEDAGKWSSYGFKTPNEVKGFRKEGYGLKEAASLNASKMPSTDWMAWRESGISPAEASQWIALGVSSVMVVGDIKRKGVTVEEAAKWRETRVPADMWGVWHAAGVNPEEVKRWNIANVTTLVDIEAYKHANVTPQEVEAWIKKGSYTRDEIIQLKSEGYTSPETKAVAERKEKACDILSALFLLVFAAVVVLGFLLGITDRAVFYMNKKDLYFSFIPYPIVIGSTFLALITSWAWIWKVGLVATFVVVFMVFRKSFKFNNRFMPAFATATAKLFFSWIFLLKLLDFFSPVGNTSRERNVNAAKALLMLGFMSFLVPRLINGDRVLGDAKECGAEDSEEAENEDAATDDDANNEVIKDEQYYATVLGITEETSSEDIHKKYRELAAKYHPDLVNHLGEKIKEAAEREMKEINEAFDFFKKKYEA